MNLDAATLNEIAIATRQCFLTEDAPEYLESLQNEIAKLDRGQPDYTALMHAAHSIKGGAGFAQLLDLSRLAHKLEDLLEILREDEFVDPQIIGQVLKQGVDEMVMVCAHGNSQPPNSLLDVAVDAELLANLDALLLVAKDARSNPNPNRSLNQSTSQITSQQATSVTTIVKTVLEKDLEACLSTAEHSLQTEISVATLTSELVNFCNECTLLGEALELPWLISLIEPLEELLKHSPDLEALRSQATHTIQSLRTQRDRLLYPPPPASQPEISSQKPEDVAPTPEAISYLRIPSSRIEGMTNTVGELIIRHERLLRQQQQLGQTNKNLRSLVTQFTPIQDQVQTLYDQLAIANPNPVISDQTLEEFDSLELDRFTTAHTSLQGLQELLTRIRETRADIDLSYRELGEEIEQLRLDLDHLYADLTQSRLVPFKNLANRFVPQLARLCQRYGKKVKLSIEGEEILVDQTVLEQLQTPLNHLLLNAFDHAIEFPEERVKLGKPETACITLTATLSANQVAISIEDDGNGIDLAKVYQLAIERGLCASSIPMAKLRREEILNFVFQPGFSTTTEVTDISGRGMGLDIVRSQITRLRGSLKLDTTPGEGTSFTILLPLGLSLLSLLICSVGSQVIALPANNVLDILLFSDLEMLEPINSRSRIKWRQQALTLLPLKELLPYVDRAIQSQKPKVCLVLSRLKSPLAVTVDAILEERQLILKPFDNTIAIPPYLAGCTILGTGKVVPVLIPDGLGVLVQSSQSTTPPTVSPLSQSQSTKTILIAEDSVTTRKMLERLLKRSGYNVISCRDGQEAIEEMNRYESKLNLVISDIEMPRVNGFSLLQTIRTHDTWYTTPVVMLTSRSGDRHRQKAMSLGATGYLSKPIVPQELVSYIDSLVTIE